MAWTDEQLSWIYDRTSGYCHLCGGKLAFTNYGRPGKRGAWEVEHSVPRARGGTDRLRNLYAAHVSCNRIKKAESTRLHRGRNGLCKAPLSRPKRRKAKIESAIAGGVLGGALGGAIFGPLGLVVGGALGARTGYKANPDHDW